MLCHKCLGSSPVARLAAVCVALPFVYGRADFVDADSVAVVRTVDSHSGPWAWVDGGLNAALQYGINDQGPPTIFCPADGLDFSPGTPLSITYLAGLTNAFGGSPEVDAVGYTEMPYWCNDYPGSSGQPFPSLHMDQSEYPVYLNALVGAFADDSGQLVGVPFGVGYGRTVTVPSGAARLQLGINDDIFADNTGGLQVQVQGTPEPSTIILLGAGVVTFLAYAWRRWKRIG
jgi:hypothetical protein